MSTPTVVFSSSGSGTGSTFSVTAPASITNGNLLLAFEWTLSTSVPSAPSGWTNLVSNAWGSVGAYYLSVFYKVASSEPGSYIFNGSSLALSEVHIINISGAAALPDNYAINTGSGPAETTNTVFTSQNNELLIAAFAVNNSGGITVSSPLSAIVGSLSSGLSAETTQTSQAMAGTSSTYLASNGTSGFWIAIVVAIPPGVAADSPSYPPLQRFCPLPEFDYQWWLEHSARPNAAWYHPPAPATRQSSQTFHQLPDSNWSWYEQFTRQPIPVGYVPSPPSTHQPSQQFYSLPDWQQEYQIYTKPNSARFFVPPPPPTKQSSQQFYELPDLTWTWYEQFTHWPTPVPFVPAPPSTKQPSQQFYELPIYDFIWWEQFRSHPLPSGILQSQEGVCGILNLMTGIAQVGGSRVANTPTEGWNVYVGAGGLPDLTQPPAAFSTTLPINTPLTPPASGLEIFYVLVQKQDKYGLQSQNQFYTTFTIDSSGNLYEPPLNTPQTLMVNPKKGGYVSVLAQYPTALTDQFPATQWYIWEGITLPNPATDTPVAIINVAGQLLQTLIGPYPPGTYYVMVGLYRTSFMTYSPTIYTQVTIPSPPPEVIAVPSGFDGN